MLAYKVHFLVDFLDAGHVCLCIICEFYLLSAADTLCAPVEITEIYRTAEFACYCMEACLPSFYRLAGSFRCKGKVRDFLALHFLDDAEYDIAAALSVNRNSSKFAEQPSERTPEHLSFDHAVRLTTYRHVIKV